MPSDQLWISISGFESLGGSQIFSNSYGPSPVSQVVTGNIQLATFDSRTRRHKGRRPGIQRQTAPARGRADRHYRRTPNSLVVWTGCLSASRAENSARLTDWLICKKHIT